MIYRLAKLANRKTWFVYACEHGGVHTFSKEVQDIFRSAEHINAHICYREPREEDVLGRDYDSRGLVTRSVLQSLLPLDNYDVYLCGPAPFMKAMYELLSDLGVSEGNISFEFFGDGVSLKTPESIQKDADQTVKLNAANGRDITLEATSDAGKAVVNFAQSGNRIAWDDEYGSLLEFAEANGLRPEFSCRQGVCNTCKCKILSGEVDYVAEPLDQPDDGEVLLCCAVPTSSITLDL